MRLQSSFDYRANSLFGNPERIYQGSQPLHSFFAHIFCFFSIMSHPSADSSVDYTGSVTPTLPAKHLTIQQLLQNSTTAEPSPSTTGTTVPPSLSNESSVTDREELVKPQSRHLWPCFSLYNKLRLDNNLRVALLKATSSAEEAATYTMIKKRHHDDPNPVLKSWLVGCGSNRLAQDHTYSVWLLSKRITDDSDVGSENQLEQWMGETILSNVEDVREAILQSKALTSKWWLTGDNRDVRLITRWTQPLGIFVHSARTPSITNLGRLGAETLSKSSQPHEWELTLVTKLKEKM
jgi:hypothetical protein